MEYLSIKVNKTTFIAVMVMLVSFALTTRAQSYYQAWMAQLDTNFTRSLPSLPRMDRGGNLYYYTIQSIPSTRLQVAKLTPEGTVAWTWTQDSLMASSYYISDIFLDTAGNCYVVGHHNITGNIVGQEYVLRVIKLNPDGQILHDVSHLPRSFGDLFVYARPRLTMDPAGELAFVDELVDRPSGGSTAQLGVVNPNGGLDLKHTANGENQSRLSSWDVMSAADGIFYARVHSWGASTTTAVKFNSSGIIWERHGLSGVLASFQVGDLGNLYGYRGDSLCRLDGDLNIVWQKQVQGTVSVLRENAVDSSILINTYNGPNSHWACLETDGTTRWEDSTNTLPKLGWPRNFSNEGYAVLQESDTDSLYVVDMKHGTVIWSDHFTFPSVRGRRGTTAFDTLGNFYVFNDHYSMKFSPAPTLTLMNANRDTLPNTDCYLIRVADNTPVYTEDTLGIVKTDADGKIQLTPVP